MPLCLLDKNVSRRYMRGLVRLARGMELPNEQASALLFVRMAQERGLRLYIPTEVQNILRRSPHRKETQTFLALVEVLHPSKYFKRWTRRLRGMRFTREDAKILALGTFGTDERREILGVHAIATYDQALINKYALDYKAIQEKLKAMTADLDPPFRDAGLPEVKRPEELL